MQAPDSREHVGLSDEETSEFSRLISVFEFHEEHLADPGLLVRFYSS
ncbi:MAG TPA: hypothetical protein VFC72_00980 [Corynebacterium sp.]|nr:hypothetical protein [Corynebacterium sp.]